VLRLVGDGRSSSEIAAHLGVAPSTVETQIKSAIRKLGATNRRHAAALAVEAERS
jgi:DNA-binding CsgD family transcriptional regulator